MAATSYEGMLSALESNGVLNLPVAMVGDLLDIDHRVKHGDESGWRGDPTMCICVNKHTGNFEVWGLDARGESYKAVTHNRLSLEIITKLREGDWQRHDVGAEVLAFNQRQRDAKAAADREKLAEVGDKLAWGIRQDFKSELGHVRPMLVTRKIGA